MKILFLVPHPQEGGVSAFSETFKETTKKEQYEYFYFRSTGKNIHFFLKLILVIQDVSRFLFILLTKKIDLIFLNPSLGINSVKRDGLYALISNLFGVKIYIHWHGWNRSYEYLLKSFFCQKGLFKAKHIRVLSQEFKEKILNYGFKNEISLGCTMVGYDLLNNEMKEKRITTKELNLLFLAAISKEKGIYETVEIYRKLQNQYPHITLTIAGNGPELDQLNTYIKKNNLKNINCLGYLTGKEKANAFEKAHIYIFPSYFEGMPISVLEAMYSGLPIVCTAVGGLNDFFIPGEMGFIFDLDADLDLIKKSIESIINDNDLYLKISKYNMDYSREHFIPQKIVGEIEDEMKRM